PAVAPAPPVVTIHLPAYRLDFRDGDTTWSYHVAIGEPRHPTPRGTFAITEITWNPARVSPARDWARDAPARARGDPTGRVTLRVPGLGVIHGTPLVASVGSAASQADVRLADADAIALARRLQRRATPGLSDAALDSALADAARPQTFAVQAPVRVVVRYELSEVRRDSLLVYPDVYAVRGASAHVHARADAMRALAASGADTLRVDARALDALVRAGGRRRAAAPLATLLRAPSDAASGVP
ncbi:MAG: L,D-transpeptidase, partial [Gemmatirosa sp.]